MTVRTHRLSENDRVSYVGRDYTIYTRWDGSTYRVNEYNCKNPYKRVAE